MICPECGERYNYYEPQCPWCGAAKPVEEKADAEGNLPEAPGLNGTRTEVEEKEIFLTYDACRYHDGKVLIIFKSLIALVSLIVFFCVFGVLFKEPITKRLLLSVFIFLVVSAIFFVDVYYSMKVVRRVKCHEDEFVLSNIYDEAVLPFGKTDVKKARIKMDFFNYLLIFVIDGETFYIDERDFPEVVKTMNKLYFGKG